MKSNPSPNRKLLVVVAIFFLALSGYFISRSKPTNQNDEPVTASSSQPVSATSAARDSMASSKSAPPTVGSTTTDATTATFPFSAYQEAPALADKPSGAPVGSAFIHVPSANLRLIYEPNQIGEFPTVATRLNDTVGVRLALDNVKPGTPVRVVIMDGGTFPAKDAVSQVIPATDWHGVAFEYTTSGNIGTHRVIVQAQGQPSRILDFNAIDNSDSLRK